MLTSCKRETRRALAQRGLITKEMGKIYATSSEREASARELGYGSIAGGVAGGPMLTTGESTGEAELGQMPQQI